MEEGTGILACSGWSALLNHQKVENCVSWPRKRGCGVASEARPGNCWTGGVTLLFRY